MQQRPGLSEFTFGIDIAFPPYLSEMRICLYNRAKAQLRIQINLLITIKELPTTNDEHEILKDHFDLHSYIYWRL